jgi:hypothetical protein
MQQPSNKLGLVRYLSVSIVWQDAKTILRTLLFLSKYIVSVAVLNSRIRTAHLEIVLLIYL